MKMHTAVYLDSGFYVVSDRAARELRAITGHKLPRHGYQAQVMLATPHGPATAWLQRTDMRNTLRNDIPRKRGWRWAIFSVRRDSGADLPALGDSFRFTARGYTPAPANDRANPLD